MMKRLFFRFLSVLVLCGSVASLTAATYGPHNLIIATDLDNVLLKRKKGSIGNTALKKIGTTKRYRRQCQNRKHLGGSHGFRCGEGLYIDACAHGDYSLATFIRIMGNHKKLKKHTLHIYQELADAGYQFYTATNIGTIFFDDLQDKFPYVFNDAFIKTGMLVDYNAEDIIEKPDKRYYQQLVTKINPHNEKYILYIDDNSDNILAAQQSGLLTIHYKNHKQLIRDLHAYNICLCNGQYKSA